MATTPARERVRKSRKRRRLGLRTVQVELSEQVIDFLLARKYELEAHRQCLDWGGGVGIRVGCGTGVGMTREESAAKVRRVWPLATRPPLLRGIVSRDRVGN